MIESAKELVRIRSKFDYTKSINNRLIKSIHCTHTNECDVIIETLDGVRTVFPPGSFIRGAVYHITIASIEFDEDKCGFIGYKY